MHTHRRSRSRLLGTPALLAAAAVGLAAGLTACGPTTTSTATGTSSSRAPVAGSPTGSPTGGVTPGGPVVTPAPSGTGSHSMPPLRGVPIEGYSAAGTVLTVYFHAGVCDKYGATADQSQPGKVLVKVVVTQHAPVGQACPMVISPQHASVDLGQPLDGRTVIDASDGQPVPQQTPSGIGMESHGPGPSQ